MTWDEDYITPWQRQTDRGFWGHPKAMAGQCDADLSVETAGLKAAGHAGDTIKQEAITGSCGTAS